MDTEQAKNKLAKDIENLITEFHNKTNERIKNIEIEITPPSNPEDAFLFLPDVKVLIDLQGD